MDYEQIELPELPLLAKAEGTKKVIAVTENERHTSLFKKLGIDHIVNPRKITQQKIIANIFRVPIGSILTFKNVYVEVSRFIAEKNSRIIGIPLSEVREFSKNSIIIGCVFHKDKVIIPSGNTIIEENDEALIICNKKNLKMAGKFFKSSILIKA